MNISFSVLFDSLDLHLVEIKGNMTRHILYPIKLCPIYFNFFSFCYQLSLSFLLINNSSFIYLFVCF